jgi:RND superfamily putative drug exporter
MVAVLLVVGWLVVGAFGGPAIGPLSDVASNDAADYLPRTSESARVQDELASFRAPGTPATLPAVVVAVRDSGITDADQAFLGQAVAEVAAAGGGPGGSQQPGGQGNPQQPGGSGDQGGPDQGQSVTVSQDGKAAQLVVPVSATTDAGEQVQELRRHLEGAPAGLTVLVTGPAGQIADLMEAFSGIDGLLLLVAGGVVALILLLVYRGPLLVLIVLGSAVVALSLAALGV